MTQLVMAAIVAAAGLFSAGPGVAQSGTYAWPVQGPVIRGFEPPPDPYSAGHRGIDIGAAFGSPMVAAQDGVVAFAGWVAGSLFISIDHPDGIRSTYSWLSAISVAQGDTIARGQAIGATGHGHPDVATPHLHFGTRQGSTYLDPMLFLEPGSVAGVIHLAPLDGAATSPRSPPGLAAGLPDRVWPIARRVAGAHPWVGGPDLAPETDGGSTGGANRAAIRGP